MCPGTGTSGSLREIVTSMTHFVVGEKNPTKLLFQVLRT
jgi:hypothetical protein